ncbi:MAG TPA: type II CAAX endopeptidase family protein [Povalibacter sp.]
MRSFASVILVFAVSLILAGVLAYPTWLLVALVDLQPIHRVLHRIAMLLAVLALYWLFRRWGLLNKQAFGFDLPARNFSWQLLAGIVSGALIILPLLVTLQILGVRVEDARIEVDAALVMKIVATGLATGLFVSLVEEGLFRGLLLTAVERESGRITAVLLSSLLYASMHFLDGRLRLPPEQIEWSSGFAVLGRMFIAYSNPAAIVDSFLALFAVGVLLSVLRIRTGGIAACIGLHTAWVCSLYYFEVTTQLNPVSAARWMVGSYDGVVGWATVAWMITMAAVYIAVARTTRSPSATAAS